MLAVRLHGQPHKPSQIAQGILQMDQLVQGLAESLPTPEPHELLAYGSGGALGIADRITGAVMPPLRETSSDPARRGDTSGSWPMGVRACSMQLVSTVSISSVAITRSS